MSIKYHLSENGPAICRATVKSCPVGGDHYDSASSAGAAFDEKMEKEMGATATVTKRESSASSTPAKDGRSKRNNWPDIEKFRSGIGPSDTVFVHPQGKIAIFTPKGEKRVFRGDGRTASTSASLADLTNGRGTWKLIKAPADSLPTKEYYAKNFENTDGGNDPTEVSSTPRKGRPRKATPQPTTDRERGNLLAGYPMDSQLDALKADEINFSDRTWASTNRPSSILPIGERGNPHRDLANTKAGEGLKFWNYPQRDGSGEYVGHFEVWSDNQGHFKAVTSAGPLQPIGSVGKFSHDQTGARMGGNWTLIGAFNAQEGGAAIGDIPDRKMPIYTYK